MKIIALMKYGDKAASTRQRLLQFKPYFNAANIEITSTALFDNDYLNKRLSGNSIGKLNVIALYYKRLKSILSSRGFDGTWVHCESFPYLFGFMERLVFLAGKPVIYDFDDAIFHQYDSHKNPIVRFLLGKKLQGLLRGSTLAICGNAYLQNYARQFCKNTIIIPTVVDTDYFRPASRKAKNKQVIIGWIGSPSTWVYVKPLVPLLSRLATELNLTIRVIGAGPQAESPPHFEFAEWSEATEVSEIQNMDIGIMPLPDKQWARGKCGYKLIQYMACGVAVVASPVGVNSDIVQPMINGFLVTSEAEWESALRKLVADAGLRTQMGCHGRDKIVEFYSLSSQGPELTNAVQKALSR
jgi:glycosyltransferase involved in cell wall biosynthesis